MDKHTPGRNGNRTMRKRTSETMNTQLDHNEIKTDTTDAALLHRYCSWCLQETDHKLQTPHRLRRSNYQCQSCENYTVTCRFCDNMAKGAPKGSVKDFFSWDNERCALHDGTIQTIHPTTKNLTDISEYKSVLNEEKSNVSVGSVIGKYLLSEYFDDDDRFDIIKLTKNRSEKVHDTAAQKNRAPINKVIVINGFLKEKDKIFQDWLQAYDEIPDNTELYGLTWASKTMGDFAKSFLSPKLANIASKKLLLAQIAYSAATNPWHVSMKKAADAGTLLGNILLHTNGEPFTLIAHSLGCRVIYYALELLKHHPHIKVKDIILLGGAVGNSTQDWEAIADSISGKIYNCHSDNDDTLHKLYNAATLKLSHPIGYYPIKSHHLNIINIDCTDLISGHQEWKNQYLAIYQRIAGTYPWQKDHPLS